MPLTKVTGGEIETTSNINISSYNVGVGTVTNLTGTNLSYGIGTFTSLQVQGNTSITGDAYVSGGNFLVGTSSSTGTASQRLQVTGGAYFSGNVGIGTINPTNKLNVYNGSIEISGNNSQLLVNGTRSVDPDRLIYANQTTSNTAASILLTGKTSGGVDAHTLLSSAPDNKFHIYVPGQYQATGTKALTIDSSGNLGIGTTNPQTLLHTQITSTASVNGTVANSYPISRFINLSSDTGARGLEIGAPTGSVTSPIYLKVSGTSNRFAILNQSNSESFTVLDNGNTGIGTNNPVKTIDIRGEATFGAGITISDLSWGKDANQLVYTFSGTAGGGNPSDGCIALVSPNANPSATRVGTLLYGNKVSGTSVTGNPGIKAIIDCYTNTNVANAADTGAYLNFYTKPDNANNRVQMILNSNGVLTKPYQPAFLAYRNSALSISATWQLISSGILTESYDVGSVYSTSTNGRFVAPVAGRYMFYAGGYSAGNTNGERYAFGVKINNAGSPDFITGGNYSNVDTPLSPYQVVLNLAANDYVELYFFSAISTTLSGATHWIYWGGYLLG